MKDGQDREEDRSEGRKVTESAPCPDTSRLQGFVRHSGQDVEED